MMEWWLVLLLIFGGLVALMVTGMPIALCFLLVNVIGVFAFWGGQSGLQQLVLSFITSVATFNLLPVPLFMLMGDVMFQSEVGINMIDALDKWLGRLPGRLALLTVGAGTLIATFTGVGMAATAVLGKTMAPEMEKRGYHRTISLGSIMGSGGLAIMIPPSSLGVLLAVLAEISVGKVLMAIVMPGVLMAIIFAAYIIIRCAVQPSIAPAYEVASPPLRHKLEATVRYVLPLGFIIFLVMGLLFLGVATPSESAATGALGCLILSAFYGRLNWQMLKKTLRSTVGLTVMTFMIIVGANAFSQIIAFTGATHRLSEIAVGLQLAPILIFIGMQLVVLLMGMFMTGTAIMMITLPIFMPIIHAVGINPVWFAAVMLLNIEIGQISPPFGMGLFVMKGVGPPGITMEDCFRAAFPFVGLDLLAMALIIAFPPIALWLPTAMR